MKFLNISFLGIACLSVASAGQIEVGQIIGGQNAGLTDAYVTSGCMGSSCVNTGTGAGGLNATAGLDSTGFTEANYDASLFANAGTKNSDAGPQPFSNATYVQTAAPAPGTYINAGSGVTFAMISDGLVGGTNGVNDWTAASANSITIPIGVFGVTEAYTMLNDIAGVAGQYTDVTFNFSQASNGSTGIDNSVTVDLVNGTEVGTSVVCSPTPCNSTQSVSSSPTSNTVNGLTVTTNQIYSTPFSFTSSGHGAGINSKSGNLVLDDQGFNISSYDGEYLVDIVVADSSGVSTTNQTALSAITLETATTPTPEPSTWLMFGVGICALGVLRQRRKEA